MSFINILLTVLICGCILMVLVYGIIRLVRAIKSRRKKNRKEKVIEKNNE